MAKTAALYWVPASPSANSWAFDFSDSFCPDASCFVRSPSPLAFAAFIITVLAVTDSSPPVVRRNICDACHLPSNLSCSSLSICAFLLMPVSWATLSISNANSLVALNASSCAALLSLFNLVFPDTVMANNLLYSSSPTPISLSGSAKLLSEKSLDNLLNFRALSDMVPPSEVNPTFPDSMASFQLSIDIRVFPTLLVSPRISLLNDMPCFDVADCQSFIAVLTSATTAFNVSMPGIKLLILGILGMLELSWALVGLLFPPLNCSVSAFTAFVSSSNSDAMLFPDNVGI